MLMIVIPARFNPKQGRFFVHGDAGEHADRELAFGNEEAFQAREALSDQAYDDAPDVPLLGVASRAFGTDMTLKEMRWVADILNAAIDSKRDKE